MYIVTLLEGLARVNISNNYDATITMHKKIQFMHC